MKVKSRNYKGIEYVNVSDLPESQKEKVLQTISPDLFIKILIDKEVISNCIQYKDYLHWFDNIYKSDVFLQREVHIPLSELILNKS
jgi:hypothetical protein